MLVHLTVLTLRNPREGLQTVLRLMPPREAIYIAMVLVIVLSMAVLELAALLRPPPSGAVTPGDLFGGPVRFFAIQVAMSLGGAGLMYQVGRAFGGIAAFEACLTALVWLNWMSFVLQSLAVLVAILLPPLAPFLTAFTIGFLLVALIVFIAEVHGFTNLLVVGFGAFASFMGAVIVLSVVLIALGVEPVLEPPQ